MDRLHRHGLVSAAAILVLVAPAAVFFLAAVGRSLQPTTHEPSRTLDAVVTWFGSLDAGAAVGLLLVMPTVGVLVAAGLLWTTWQRDRSLQGDLRDLGRALAAFVRRPAFVVAVLVLAFAAVFFAAITVHAVTG